MNKQEAMLAGVAMAVTLVLVLLVGSLGLLLFPLVLAEIAGMIWGKPPINTEETEMGRSPRRGHAFELEDIESIISAAQRGDESAWRELVTTIHPFLLGISRQFCQTASHIIPPEELEQLMWFDLWHTKLAKYSPGNFHGWLWTATRNKFSDELRLRRNRFGEVTEDMDITVADIDETIELFDWLNGLPPEDSFAIFLRDVCNHEWMDVVQAMNVAFPRIVWSRNACQRAANRARARLSRLEEDC